LFGGTEEEYKKIQTSYPTTELSTESERRAQWNAWRVALN